MKPYYEHAGITIYRGDCREILPQLPKARCVTCACDLQDESILAIHLAGGHQIKPYCDLCLTDPPYGIGFAASPSKWSRDNLRREACDWDNDIPDIEPLLNAATVVMIWGGNHFPLPPSRGWLVWVKPAGLPSYGTAELCWTNIEMPVRHLECERCNGDKYDHPTQKPIPLIKWCLGFAPEASSVIDPYMGTGTTLRAAKDSGRRAIGIEIEEKYCEIASRRLSQEVFHFGDH